MDTFEGDQDDFDMMDDVAPAAAPPKDIELVRPAFAPSPATSRLLKETDLTLELGLQIDVDKIAATLAKESKGKGRAAAGGAPSGPLDDNLPWFVLPSRLTTVQKLTDWPSGSCTGILQGREVSTCHARRCRLPQGHHGHQYVPSLPSPSCLLQPLTLADHVSNLPNKTVEKFIDAQRLPHLLFYGPPGTGKTSTILAVARRIYGQDFKKHMLEVGPSFPLPLVRSCLVLTENRWLSPTVECE